MKYDRTFDKNPSKFPHNFLPNSSSHHFVLYLSLLTSPLLSSLFLSSSLLFSSLITSFLLSSPLFFSSHLIIFYSILPSSVLSCSLLFTSLLSSPLYYPSLRSSLLLFCSILVSQVPGLSPVTAIAEGAVQDPSGKRATTSPKGQEIQKRRKEIK